MKQIKLRNLGIKKNPINSIDLPMVLYRLVSYEPENAINKCATPCHSVRIRTKKRATFCFTYRLQPKKRKILLILWMVIGDFIILGQDPQSTLIPILYPIGYNPIVINNR